MKKIVLGLFLTFAALTCLASPALAEEAEEAKEPQAARVLSAADRAFLASLARMPIAPAPAAKPPKEDPPVEAFALCTATADCWDGSTRYCEGNNSSASCTAVDSNCPGQRGYVTCDGVTTWCPVCETEPCPEGWCEGEQDCAANCYPCNYTYTCNETYCLDHCKCKWATCPF